MTSPALPAGSRRAGGRALGAVLLALAAAPLLPAGPQGSGQDAPAPTLAAGAFTEVAEVELVDVAVRVSDRKGRAVAGLTAEAFTLFVDGREVEISHFAPPGEGEGRGGRRAAGTAGLAPGSELGGGGRRIVLLLDQQHLEPGGRARVIEGMDAFVEGELAPGDEVMVAAHQGGRLQVLAPFTSDRAALRAALRAIAGSAPAGLLARSGRREIFRRMQFALSETPGDAAGSSCEDDEAMSAQAAVRAYAGEVASEVEAAVGALDSLVAALSAVPGDKVVLYAGDGLELRPALDVFQLLLELCGQHQSLLMGDFLAFDLTTSFTRLAAHANANRVTFYTLQASGIEADGVMDGPGTHFRPSTVGRRVRAANLRHPLYLMASETGGRAIFDTNRFAEPLAEVAADLDRVYSLAFVPDHPSEGRVHVLRVEVAGRGLEVRHRRSYEHRPLTERIGERMISTLALGAEDNPLGVEVSAGAAVRGEGGWRLPVRVRVPLDHVLLSAGDGHAVGRLRLVLTARTEHGEWLPVKQKEALVRVEGRGAGGAPGEERRFEIELELPPGEHVIAVGVRDEIGGTASFLRRTVAVAAPGESPSAAEG